jgi:hypothetical protein
MDEDNPSNNTRTLKEVSAFVVLFSRFKSEESIRQVMGWKRYANFVEKSSLTKKSYFLPMTSIASEHEYPSPDNSFMVSNNILDPDLDVYLSLCWFFDEMQELAEPRATILVRELTNNGLRDDNDTLDVPAWMAKIDLYR